MIPKRTLMQHSSKKLAQNSLLREIQDDLIIERPCLEILQNSEVINQIQIINGMEEGNITQALNGEHVGTIIYKE